MQDQAFIWNQYDLIRGMTVAMLASIDEETADIIPENFNNNIRWNLGHILLCQDFLLFGPEGVQLPPAYGALFAPATKPANWQGDIPSLETLSAQLKEQSARIKEALQDRLNEPLPQPFQLGDKGTIYTYGEMLTFTLFHEGMHMGCISGLRKGIAAGSK